MDQYLYMGIVRSMCPGHIRPTGYAGSMHVCLRSIPQGCLRPMKHAYITICIKYTLGLTAWTHQIHYTYAHIFVLETRNTASPIILAMFLEVDAGGAGCIVI